MDNLVGMQLGPYQIISALGAGGMAAVYRAYQPATERYVALKILPRHLASDPQFVSRFQQEAKIVAQLQHPHILPVFDFGEVGGYTYLVMPFVAGGTLANGLTGRPLPLPQICAIISQVGDALDYAHARGLVHRDVKPSNILMDERGNCLLTDFGLAKMVEGSIRLTASGAILGTPAYMSPEQGLGQSLDHRSDVYSLGVVLYEMAVGCVPYNAETPIAVVFKHVNDPLPLPRAANPDLPEALERIILKALAKKPDDRYATAGEMVRAVQAVLPARPVAPAVGKQQARFDTMRQHAAEFPPTVRTQPSIRGVPAFKWAFVAGGLFLVMCIGLFAILIVGTAHTNRPPSAAAPTATSLSDSFNRADADRCALGQADLALGGSGVHYYLPIWSYGGTDATNPIGANIVSNALQNNGLNYGGVQFTASSGACSSTAIRGENIGQDMNIRVDLWVPTDAANHVTQAGPYFRSRAAARGDGLIGGTSAGYWIQLHSTGQVKVKMLNPHAITAFTEVPASFDNTVFHTLEIAVQGNTLQVALDEQLLTFSQGDNLVTTVAITATSGYGEGTAGISFGAEPNGGLIGGQRADNLVVSAYHPLSGLPSAYTISGRVTDDSVQPLAGVTVSAGAGGTATSPRNRW